jgi:hypothetical protein
MNNKLNKVALILAAPLLFPTLAAAHNYTYVEGGFIDRDTGLDRDAGFRIAGSANVASPIALFGEYADTGDFSQLSAGALFHTPLNSVLDLVAGGSIEHADTGSRDDTGFGIRGGVRWQLIAARLELNPEIRHVDVLDDSGTSVRLAALYRVARRLDVQGAVQGGDDDRFELGLRYNFGPRLTGGA